MDTGNAKGVIRSTITKKILLDIRKVTVVLQSSFHIVNVRKISDLLELYFMFFIR